MRLDRGSGTVTTLYEDAADLAAPLITPDSREVLFQRNPVRAVYRIDIDGGTPALVREHCALNALHPNGRWLLCCDSAGVEHVVARDGGGEIWSRDLPARSGMSWLGDAVAFLPLPEKPGAGNVFMQRLDGSDPVQITNFSSAETPAFACSPDVKHIVVARDHRVRDLALLDNVPYSD
jgi:hypothetical protein